MQRLFVVLCVAVCCALSLTLGASTTTSRNPTTLTASLTSVSSAPVTSNTPTMTSTTPAMTSTTPVMSSATPARTSATPALASPTPAMTSTIDSNTASSTTVAPIVTSKPPTTTRTTMPPSTVAMTSVYVTSRVTSKPQGNATTESTLEGNMTSTTTTDQMQVTTEKNGNDDSSLLNLTGMTFTLFLCVIVLAALLAIVLAILIIWCCCRVCKRRERDVTTAGSTRVKCNARKRVKSGDYDVIFTTKVDQVALNHMSDVTFEVNGEVYQHTITPDEEPAACVRGGRDIHAGQGSHLDVPMRSTYGRCQSDSIINSHIYSEPVFAASTSFTDVTQLNKSVNHSGDGLGNDVAPLSLASNQNMPTNICALTTSPAGKAEFYF